MPQPAATARPDPQVVSFDVSDADARLIQKITTRALKLSRKHGVQRDRLSTNMDIAATHANGNPLDLAKLLAADDFNLAHDVFGIERHLDRRTGKLTGFFSPRCSLPVADEAEAA